MDSLEIYVTQPQKMSHTICIDFEKGVLYNKDMPVKRTNKRVYMTRKYHNQRSQTNPLHHEEETQTTDIHMTAIFMNKNSEYDQEIPQSQLQTNPWHREEEPHNNHETPGRQTKQSNWLFLLHRDDCKTRMDTK